MNSLLVTAWYLAASDQSSVEFKEILQCCRVLQNSLAATLQVECRDSNLRDAFIEVFQELWEQSNHWAGDNGPPNQTTFLILGPRCSVDCDPTNKNKHFHVVFNRFIIHYHKSTQSN